MWAHRKYISDARVVCDIRDVLETVNNMPDPGDGAVRHESITTYHKFLYI